MSDPQFEGGADAPVRGRSASTLTPMPSAPDVSSTTGGPRYLRRSSAAAERGDDAASAPLRRERRERQSFLHQDRRDEPARRGTRGALNRIGFKLAPGATEQAVRDDQQVVGQHWPGPRTIAIVNGKGGAGKTPTTALLSAVFARYGGAGVLAWDNNQTRGTLGWRTESSAHERTLLELLPETERLLGASAQSADLAQFVHHQPREKYDVLRSKPIRLAHENRLHPADVDAIHAVAAKFYRVILIDSGNDESDPMWLRMIDHADQVVVATTTRDDHAEAGALLLEALAERDERSARLARNSVVVVSQADPKATGADVQQVVSGYRELARDVVSIPFDHEMVDGTLLLGGLAPATQRAWLTAAAAVARGL
ncbi:AAA family ATPase [Microbacterium sp. NPDC057659]|uniref:MinD/ParA family ATP-binding protein n=1 Tax=Microbacterium sp. NPDC057659 TaxID=3346198 RepID=UPI0036714B5C